MTKKHDPFALYRAWWADAGSRLAPYTVKTYRYHVLKTIAETGKDPLTMKEHDLAVHLGEMRPQFAKVRRGALFDFYGFLVKKGHRSSNPLEYLKTGPKPRVRVKRGLTEDELNRLLVAAVWGAKPRFSGTRLAWAITAQYAMGLRPGELQRLTPDRINLDGSAPCVYVTETKTGVDRVVPMSPLAQEAVTELMADQRGDTVTGIGRTAYWQKVRRAALWAGIPPEKSRSYSLRHSFATHLAQRGIRAAAIAELLGHKDLRHTMGYMVAGDDELRRAVGVLR